MPASALLIKTVARLSAAENLESITREVSEAARQIAGSDGSTFVIRDGEHGELCYYVDENAISPLWSGRRFPLENCISGWCMNHQEVVRIPDIYKDARIPHDAYRPTFVKSLCMVPIREDAPLGAIGTYWAREYTPTDDQIKLLRTLADISAIAIENMTLKKNILHCSAERAELLTRQKQLEIQLHSLAHDIKNPLFTMLGFAEILQTENGRALDDKSRQYLESILRTGKKLNKQVERMLAFFRLNHQSVCKKVVNLSAIAEELIEDYKLRNPNRRVDAVVTPNLKAFADPDLIRLALENLISNAFKYSSRKPSSRIIFGKQIDHGKEHYFVEDNGDGFDPSRSPELFKPLGRLHNQSDFSGTGLGLASVATIIEAHGGSVSAIGRPKQGARFSFNLPEST